MTRILGIDPGLTVTGWGIIDMVNNRLMHVGNGMIKLPIKIPVSERLKFLYDAISAVIQEYRPVEAAVEETFQNVNPKSTLTLGLARGVCLLAPACFDLPVAQYLPNTVKKTITGAGHAQKNQVEMMIERLLPTAKITGSDAADALAVAMCHAHIRETQQKWEKV